MAMEIGKAWFLNEGPDSDAIISSRARYARNLLDYPFPGKMSKEDEAAIQGKIGEALDASLSVHGMSGYSLEALDPVDLRVLVERSLISQPYSVEPYRLVYVNGSHSLSAVVNETEHLRFQSFRTGLDLTGAFAELERVDEALMERLSFAAALDAGFVTTDISNFGTGLRVSVILHLPVLTETGLAEKAFRGALQRNITVRGFYGEEGKSQGALFQISNSVSIGMSETEILELVYESASRIAKYERMAREETAERDALRLSDSVSRALGTAKSARLLPFAESVEVVSQIRLGVTLGWISGLRLPELTALFYSLQTGHLQRASVFSDDKGRNEPIDAIRARTLRELTLEARLEGGINV